MAGTLRCLVDVVLVAGLGNIKPGGMQKHRWRNEISTTPLHDAAQVLRNIRRVFQRNGIAPFATPALSRRVRAMPETYTARRLTSKRRGRPGPGRRTEGPALTVSPHLPQLGHELSKCLRQKRLLRQITLQPEADKTAVRCRPDEPSPAAGQTVGQRRIGNRVADVVDVQCMASPHPEPLRRHVLWTKRKHICGMHSRYGRWSVSPIAPSAGIEEDSSTRLRSPSGVHQDDVHVVVARHHQHSFQLYLRFSRPFATGMETCQFLQQIAGVAVGAAARFCTGTIASNTIRPASAGANRVMRQRTADGAAAPAPVPTVDPSVPASGRKKSNPMPVTAPAIALVRRHIHLRTLQMIDADDQPHAQCIGKDTDDRPIAAISKTPPNERNIRTPRLYARESAESDEGQSRTGVDHHVALLADIHP